MDEEQKKAFEPYYDQFKKQAIAEASFTLDTIQTINKDLTVREQASVPFNGMPYSQAYVYNQKKAINYAPPKGKDDNEISLGMVHEKIIGFCAFFIKYAMKRRVKCYDEHGNLVRGMGEIYDLAIEHSYRLEDFKQQLGFLYWETFTQGAAFVQELWDVRTVEQPIAMKDGKAVGPDGMDYTYEFLEGLTYKKGEPVQVRKAVSRLLDGRMVIFGNPEITNVQDQPHITLEEIMSEADAEQIFGSLEAYKKAPKTRHHYALGREEHAVQRRAADRFHQAAHGPLLV